MKFLWTTIHVKKLEESIDFYSEVIGLKVINRFKAGKGMEIAFMGNGIDGETLVELLEDNNNVNHGDSISIGFAIASVEEMIEVLKEKNVPIQSGRFETPDAEFFFIKDPNGANVQLFQRK